ncbi:hypothetical protein OHA61_06215 [Streptomyces sp. NBC_00885]|uniref:hypothetical protein n=1 Tax=Streptomyces sp. NBC_00885 TaxID=2975857 RepID=UPI003867AC48|nr:hypothetical protein OHA61_06215 [Streptomyces sp. NBC_00885]
MTDTTIAPEAGTEAPPDTTPPPAEPTPAPAAAEVEHTPGGWPVVPLAVTGTNTTTSLLAAAALVGGPAALAVAATGAVVLGTVAAATRHRRDRKGKTTTGRAARTRSASVGRASRHGAGRVPGQSRNGNAGTTKATGRSRGKSPRAAAGSPTAAKAGGLNRSPRKAAGSSPSAVSSKARGKVGQVKSLRDSARKASPSRAARRNDTQGARRSVADARRKAKADQRSASLAKKGPVGRAVGKAAGRIGKARGAAIERARKARDQRTAGQVAGQRDQVRKAPARKQARKALRRSAARLQRRRLLAALLAGALGIVGLITSPIGRKLGLPWLVHPGRRLYARMMRTADEQRTARDEEIRAALQDAEAAVDAEAAEDNAGQIGDTAKRPAGPTPTAPTSSESSEGEIVSGFRFEEYAAEMEAAANSYDPEDAMEILAMVEGLPAALTSVANVMRILAERADSEFPLEKEVADGFNDIFGALMSAVAVAEDMGPLFRQAHEQDIARHEDPRNGTEAEKGWNV